MKKTLLVLSTVAALTLALVACKQPTSGTSDAATTPVETTVTPTVASISSITLEDNTANGNYQAILTWLADSNEYVAASGDTLHFVIEGTSDKAVTEYKAFLVDNSEAAGWWKVVSSYVNTGVSATAGGTVSMAFDVALTSAASSKAANACKLGLYCDADGNEVSTLTVTKFEVTLK